MKAIIIIATAACVWGCAEQTRVLIRPSDGLKVECPPRPSKAEMFSGALLAMGAGLSTAGGSPTQTPYEVHDIRARIRESDTCVREYKNSGFQLVDD